MEQQTPGQQTPRPRREGAVTHKRRRLDRLHEPSRNADYMLRDAAERRELERERVVWEPGPILDQGSDGACVAFGWTQELLTSPVRVDLSAVVLPAKWPSRDPNRFAKRLYYAAQRHDQWEGGAYKDADPVYEGTSVVAGAKQVRRLGFLADEPGSYRWAFNWQELADGVLGIGPAVIGVGWRDSMFDPHPAGILRVEGAAVGGHCVLVNGYEPSLRDRLLGDASGDVDEADVADAVMQGLAGDFPAFHLVNSWGADWSVNGGAWIAASAMQTLIDDQGDVCVPVHRSYGEQRG